MSNSKCVFVFTFVFFFASCNVLVGGRDLAKVQGDNSSTNARSLAEIVEQYTHIAGYYSIGEWGGVGAKINVWAIQDVHPQSNSSAFIVARNQGEMISAGIHVYPGMYQNKDVRFFTYWTSDDGISMGCFNTACQGFVIANGANLVPGQAMAPPFSTYGGEQRYITLRIKKDQHRGEWSLYREDRGGPTEGMTLLGWWPETLFKNLSNFANKIEWKGEVSYHYDETSPSMGSGHSAQEYQGKAAFFQNILGFSSNGDNSDPNQGYVSRNVDKKECYNVSDWFKDGENDQGCHFFYGGPSGCPDM